MDVLATYLLWDNELGMMLVSSFKVRMFQFVISIFYNIDGLVYRES